MTGTRGNALSAERVTSSRAISFAPAVVATLLGAFLILGAGFAPISAVHNAAHDSRHAFAFPCH